MQITYSLLIGVLVLMPYTHCAPNHGPGHTGEDDANKGQIESEKKPLLVLPSKVPEVAVVEPQGEKFVTGSGNATFSVLPISNVGPLPATNSSSVWLGVSKPVISIPWNIIPSLFIPQFQAQVNKPGNGNFAASGSFNG